MHVWAICGLRRLHKPLIAILCRRLHLNRHITWSFWCAWSTATWSHLILAINSIYAGLCEPSGVAPRRVPGVSRKQKSSRCASASEGAPQDSSSRGQACQTPLSGCGHSARLMQRRRSAASDGARTKRPVHKRSVEHSGLSSVNHYCKVLGIWCTLLVLDHVFRCRLELLVPVITLWRSMSYVFRVEGTGVTILFLSITLMVDVICLYVVPLPWLFFVGSTYVWVQLVWHADSDLYIGTIVLFLVFVYVEASVRLHVFPAGRWFRMLAAHCTGSPMMMLGLDLKDVVMNGIKQRRHWKIVRENKFYFHLIEGGLPPPLRIQCREDIEAAAVFSTAERPRCLLGALVHLASLKWFCTTSSNLDMPKPYAQRQDSDVMSAMEITEDVYSLTKPERSSENVRRRKPDHGQSVSHVKPSSPVSTVSSTAKSKPVETIPNGCLPTQALKAPNPSSSGQASSVPLAVETAETDHIPIFRSSENVCVPEKSLLPTLNKLSPSFGKKTTTPTATVSPVQPVPSQQRGSNETSSSSSTNPAMARLQQELMQIKSQFVASQQREERLSEEADDLRGSVQKLRAQLKEARSERDNCKEELRASNDLKRSVQGTADSLHDQLLTAKQAHQLAESQLRSLSQQVSRSNSTIHEVCNTHQASLEREITRLKRTVERLETEVQDVQSTATTHQQKLVNEREKILEQKKAVEARNQQLEGRLHLEMQWKDELLSAVHETQRRLERTTRLLDDKTVECHRLKQQMTEILAVMPSSPSPTDEGQLAVSPLLSSMNDFTAGALKLGESLLDSPLGNDSEETSPWPKADEDLPPVVASAVRLSDDESPNDNFS